MTHRTQSGRTLLETLAVLVVIAILMLASIIGYNVIIHQWRKHQTVKQITELAVRYKLRPMAKSGPVDIKTIYPEADRASAVEMKTADTDAGRVQLEVFSEPTSFAVIVQHILDDSCESLLENGDYDAVVEGNDINADSATSKNAYSKQYIQSLNDNEKAALIAKICQGDTHTMGLVYGDHCPRMGATYWYSGRCWQCPSNKKQDKFGNCCEQPNSCNVCQDEAHDCREGKSCPGEAKTVCDAEDTHLCVECWDDANCTCRSTSVSYHCSNKHCCPEGLEWNGSQCVCPSGSELCGTTCCEDLKTCVTNTSADPQVKTCCDNTGEDKTICYSPNCCASGNCTNNHCCPVDKEYAGGNDKCCDSDKLYDKYGTKWCCSVTPIDGYCPDDCEGCWYNGHCYADGATVEECGKCNEDANEVQTDTTKKKDCHKCDTATWRWVIDASKTGQPISTNADNCGKCKADGTVETMGDDLPCRQCSNAPNWVLDWINPANTKPCGSSCCPTAQNCVTNGTTNTCCANTGANGTACGTNDACCMTGSHCTNGYCCSTTDTWVASMTGADKCCLTSRIYTKAGVQKCCPENLVGTTCPADEQNCTFGGTEYTPEQTVLDCGVCNGATGQVVRNTTAAPNCKTCDEKAGSATQWRWVADATKVGQYIRNLNPRQTADDCKVCLANGSVGLGSEAGQTKDIPCASVCCPHNQHCSLNHCCPANSEWEDTAGKCVEHCPTNKPSILKQRCTYLENENCCGGDLTCVHNPASSDPKEGLCVGACPTDEEVGIVLVLDRSGSMGGDFTYTDEETKEKEKVKRYNAVDKALAKLKTYKVEGSADDGWLYASVYEHDAGGKTRLGWGKHTATAIKNVVFDYKNGGNTGFSHAFKQIENSCDGTQKFVILWLTDGAVNSDTDNLKKKLKNRKCKATLYMASTNSKDKATYSADKWTNITSFSDSFISEFNSAVQDELCVPRGARIKNQALGTRSCSAGYGYYAGQCNKCPDNAVSCDWGDLKCKTNSCLSKNGKKCTALPTGGYCDATQSDGISCSVGYYKDSHTCKACIANAASCTSATNFTCKNGYYKDNKACVACPANATCSNNNITCNTGYYKHQKTCLACVENAASCTSATNFTCKNGYYKDNKACVACPANATCSNNNITCNAGFYKSGKTCKNCVANAASCTGATSGIKCNPGYFLKNHQCNLCPANANCSSGEIVCNAGFYKSASECKTCKGYPNSTCKSGTSFTCNGGFYKAGNTCNVCPANATCSDNKIACNAGFYEKNDVCLACVANAASCTGPTANIKCNAGYYKDSGACKACPANATCAGGTASFCCNENFYKKNGACTACPAGKTTKGGTCKTSSSACKS